MCKLQLEATALKYSKYQPEIYASIHSTAEVRRVLPFSLKCHNSTACLEQEGARFVGAPW